LQVHVVELSTCVPGCLHMWDLCYVASYMGARAIVCAITAIHWRDSKENIPSNVYQNQTLWYQCFWDDLDGQEGREREDPGGGL
jgi:hypothetical protein